MVLYLYKTGKTVPVVVIEDAVAYTADQVIVGDGTIYEPLEEGYELSSLPDCSETLRADWRANNPSVQARLNDVEALLAALLFGGEAV